MLTKIIIFCFTLVWSIKSSESFKLSRASGALKSPTLPLQARSALYATPAQLFPRALTINTIGTILLSVSNQRSLTPLGLVHSGLLGVGLWTHLGFAGYLVCVAYLVLGSAVTKVKMAEKERLGISEKRGGARGPENVWGSAATAMVCALLAARLPIDAPFNLRAACRTGYVAALATKLSDTFQSEIGKAYGRTAFLITTLQRVSPGTEGAVSMEGYLAGIMGSILLPLLALKLGVITSSMDIALCVLAALVANTAESYIGATLQTGDKAWMTNELVNVANTIIGACVAVVGKILLS